MQAEIQQQPEILARLLSKAPSECLSRPRLIMIAARGTSDNAAHYGKYLFESLNGIPVALAAPSVFGIYEAQLDLRDVLVIGISQSGQAADVIQVLARGAEMGARTLAITNDAESPLARTAQEVMLLEAGPEKAVAATKTYTASLACLLRLSLAFNQSESLKRDIQRLPHWVERCLNEASRIRDRVERFRYLEQCVVLGRGFNLSTALELSLKLRETSYIQAQPFPSPDFLHGPIAVVERGYPVLAIAPQGRVLPSLVEVIQKAKARGAEAVVFSNSQEALKWGDVGISIGDMPDIPEYLTPFPAIVAGQIFAQALAVTRGLDPDEPRGLRKVTITH